MTNYLRYWNVRQNWSRSDPIYLWLSRHRRKAYGRHCTISISKEREDSASATGGELPRFRLAFDDHEGDVIGGLGSLREFS